MNNTPLLSLTANQFALSKPLSDDIEFIDTLLGTVLSQQEDVEVVAIARALYKESDEDPRKLMERMPRLHDPRIVVRAQATLPAPSPLPKRFRHCGALARRPSTCKPLSTGSTSVRH
jgi:hypothetical protein